MKEEKESHWDWFKRTWNELQEELKKATKTALWVGVICILLIITLNSALGYSMNTSKMVLWFDMNESSGPIYDQIYGLKSNYTHGYPTYSGNTVQGIYFDDNSTFWFNASALFNKFGTADYTVCVAANSSNQNSDYQAPFGADDYKGVAGYSGWYLQREPIGTLNKMTYNRRNVSQVTVTGTSQHNAEASFTLYCGVHQSGYTSLFVNGTAEGSNTSDTNFIFNNANLKIGQGDDQWAGANHWKGNIKRAFIYNGSLPVADMVAIHNNSYTVTWCNITGTCNATTPATPIYINFINQSPSDITSTNAVGGVNITYNFTDPALNTSSPYLNWTVKNSSGSIIYNYVNGTRSTEPAREAYSSVSGTNYTFTFDDNIYRGSFNIDPHNMSNLPHFNKTLTSAVEMCKVELLNLSPKTYDFFEADLVLSSASAFSDIWYCNTTYTTGLPGSNANCAFIGSFNFTGCQHRDNQSCHNIIPIGTTGGKYKNVTVTPTSYFLIGGAGLGTAYLGYVNQTPRATATACTTNRGISWTNQAWVADAHVHNVESTDYFEYTPYYTNTTGSVFNGTVRTDNFDVTLLAPSGVLVSLNTNATNYGDTLLVTRTDAVIYTGNLSRYSYQLYTSAFIYYATLNASTNASSQTWNVSNVNSGVYYAAVVVTDSNNMSSISFSEPFTIRNEIITPCNTTLTMNSTGVSVLFNYTTDGYINRTDIYAYMNILNKELVASTIGYATLNLSNGTYTLYINNTHNDTTAYYFDAACTINACRNNWEKTLQPCINNLELQYYVDDNTCPSVYELPAANGSYVACVTPANTDKDLWLIILLLVLYLFTFILGFFHPLFLVMTFIISFSLTALAGAYFDMSTFEALLFPIITFFGGGVIVIFRSITRNDM